MKIEVVSAQGEWSALVLWPVEKTIIVSQDYFADVVKELIGRKLAPAEVIPVDRPWDLDMGGPLLLRRQSIEVEIDGLRLSIPCHDWLLFVESVRETIPVSLPSGKECYVVHGFGRKVILSGKQYESFCEQLARGSEEAMSRAEEDIREMVAFSPNRYVPKSRTSS